MACWPRVSRQQDVLRQYDLAQTGLQRKCGNEFGLTRSGGRCAPSPRSPMPSTINRSIAPAFRKDAAQPYDDRIIRFVKDGTAVNLWTVEGRITVPVVMGEHQQRLMRPTARAKSIRASCAASGTARRHLRHLRDRQDRKPPIGLSAWTSVSSRLPSIAMAPSTPASRCRARPGSDGATQARASEARQPQGGQTSPPQVGRQGGPVPQAHQPRDFEK